MSFDYDMSYEMFVERLNTAGVFAETVVEQNAMEELFEHIQLQQVKVSKKGNRLLQEYATVKVYLLAKIAGDELCLFEHDRFNLRDGSQNDVMCPLQVRLRTGETWQEAARRGLETMVGLQPEWQEKYLSYDESSYICLHDDTDADSAHPLDILTSALTHEVHCRVKSANSHCHYLTR